MVDLDCLELDRNANPIAVISTKLIPIDDMSPEQMASYVERKGYTEAFDSRAYTNIANKLEIPAFLLLYKRSLQSFYVVPLNRLAEQVTHARPLSYIDWYSMMCNLHGLSGALTPDEEEALLAEIQRIQESEDAAEQLIRGAARA